MPDPAGTPIERVQPSGRSTRLLLAFLLLAVVGIAVAAELTIIHARAHTGPETYRSFCSISATVNCDTVARSAYSMVLGVPVSVWGLAGYLAMAVLAATGLRRNARPGWPAGLLLLLAAAAVLAAIALAAVSKLVLHTWCILCALAWTVNVALLVVAVALARRAGGAGAAVRDDVRAAAGRPLAASATLGAVVALAAALVAVYPRLRPAPVIGPSGLLVGADGDGAPWIGSARPALTVVEFTAPGCDACERAHREMRSLLKRHRSELRLVHRTFPDDAACNPGLTGLGRPGSCRLATAAICADRQGKFWEMTDALVRAGDAAGPTLRSWAVRLGLDVDGFERCLDSDGAAQRIASDVAAAHRAGVTRPPAFVVAGQTYASVPAGEIERRLGRAEQAPLGLDGESPPSTAAAGRPSSGPGR